VLEFANYTWHCKDLLFNQSYMRFAIPFIINYDSKVLDTIATFTCQATVHKNEKACSDVIVPFGLHVWKSFTCGRRVGETYTVQASVATSDVSTADLMVSEKFLMSDVLATNLMLTALLFLFATFSLIWRVK